MCQVGGIKKLVPMFNSKKSAGEGIKWEIGIDIYTLLCIK